MFAKNLRSLRKKAGLSQRELALRLNVTQGTVCHWEQNRNQPTREGLQELCKVLGCKAEDLMESGGTPCDLDKLREDMERDPRRRALIVEAAKVRREDLDLALRLLRAIRGN